MVTFLVIASILAAAAGLMSVTEATMGVYLVGVACWLGVLARIQQASVQHERVLNPPKKPIDYTGMTHAEAEAASKQ